MRILSLKLTDRLCVPLDGMDTDEARQCVDDLYPLVGGFKLGHERIQKQDAGVLTRHIFDAGCWAFWDGKIIDIPETVKNGVSSAAAWPGVSMTNVMCLGGRAMMKSAVEGVSIGCPDLEARPWVLGVTVLTSISPDELLDMIPSEFIHAICEYSRTDKSSFLTSLVCHLAQMAKECGLDGVVASAQETTLIRNRVGPNFKIITPGIRPAGGDANDQKRTTTPTVAIEAGSDVLIVGRPITQPKSGTRADAAKRIVDEIATALG
ncbi:MAG: orotidine-5'-phosphate decarboxylase [Candidatus Berkelbacteria bacterium]|nr:orotidine-5'-phosphate decarboxylase [Candidatus Berkelbacteria bacterium]MCR4307344.1 orotidine-5'-phosphate decarboxylase [Candidatus Berkelbacteria bacterium]